MGTDFYYYYSAHLLAALILAVMISPLIRSLAFRLGALDRGRGRRIHSGIVPRLGGLGIYVSFMLPMVFSMTRGTWDEFHTKLLGIMSAGTVILVIGAWDDLKGAPIRNKLIAEVVAALMIYAGGIRIEVLSNPFNGILTLGWLSLPVTVLWIVVITNAFNLVDGLDGLASGTGILIAGTLFFLAGDRDVHLRLTLVILIGALLGFLRHNFPPATIFMGDSGSLFLGFILASITIVSSFKATAMATIMVPLVAYAHPLMDMIYAVLRRYYRGMPLGEADREHIHHKLLDKGMSKRHVLLTLYLVNFSIMALLFIVIRRRFHFPILGLVAFVAACVAGLRIFGYIEFRTFARENLKNLEVGRKRRYCAHIVKRFQGEARECATGEQLRERLRTLFSEYNLRRAEIVLDVPGPPAPWFTFFSGAEGGQTMDLEFPLVHEGRVVGCVRLSKDVDDSFLCTAELARALSTSIASFLSNARGRT